MILKFLFRSIGGAEDEVSAFAREGDGGIADHPGEVDGFAGFIAHGHV